MMSSVLEHKIDERTTVAILVETSPIELLLLRVENRTTRHA
jgi:hypothetical protein